MQISFCFCKTCICLKILENIQIFVNRIDRLDIIDEYSVKCDFILNTVTFIDAAYFFFFFFFFFLEKIQTCNVLWFYLFGQGVPNETKGTINLNFVRGCSVTKSCLCLTWNRSGGSRGGSGGSNEPPLEPKLFHFHGEFQKKIDKLHKSNPPQLIWTPDPKILDPPPI